MPRIAIPLLHSGVLALALTSACGQLASPPTAAPVSTTRAVTSARDSYELSERCGRTVREWFMGEWGQGTKTDPDGTRMSSSFASHYNAKLNKCFLVLRTNIYSTDRKTGARTLSQSWDLNDFNDNRDVGDYFKSNDELSPTSCEVGEQKCASAEAWDALVRPYMQD